LRRFSRTSPIANTNEEELRQKNEEMERFVYTISHDLKSPLVTIQAFLRFLEKDLRNLDHERVRKDMDYISNAATRMNRLLEELLQLSRIGRKVNPYEEVLLQDVVRDALKLAAGRIAEGGIHVELTREPILLYGDRMRLVEVFQNLLDNAAKFARGQASPTIWIGTEEGETGVILYVKDNGMGVDPRHLGKLFGLFEKLDPSSEGTGVGLALVKRIIEVHGGRIWVESDGPGLGTVFRFTLPNTRRVEVG
jgi:signal transduction histidine kinase